MGVSNGEKKGKRADGPCIRGTNLETVNLPASVSTQQNKSVLIDIVWIDVFEANFDLLGKGGSEIAL